MSEHQAPNDEDQRLNALGSMFMAALKAKDSGKLDKAEETLISILRQEPRLPEPRMELARILLDSDRLVEAEDHVRTALDHLRAGGQWIDEVPEHVLLALAHALLAEILRRRIDQDDVIFGDPDEFKRLVAESRTNFSKAHELDPSDEYASYYAFFMGPEDHKVVLGPDIGE
jgi:tetratricopeptide (TPR) repeat protein